MEAAITNVWFQRKTDTYFARICQGTVFEPPRDLGISRFQTWGAMMIEADINATRVRHYSTFDRTPADIDDADKTALDRLMASLDYLDDFAGVRRIAAPAITGPEP